jgi:hypothetical protein
MKMILNSIKSIIMFWIMGLCYFTAPFSYGSDFHITGHLSYSPIGKSFRVKDPIFIPDKDKALIGGIYLDGYSKGSLYFFRYFGQEGFVGYHDENGNIKYSEDNENQMCFGYGRSLVKERKVIAFVGCGIQNFEIGNVKDVSGKKVMDFTNNKSDARPCLWVGLITGVNRPIGFEYDFCTSWRVRHQVVVDVQLGRDISLMPVSQVQSPDFGFNVLRWYLRCGGGFDERKAYNIFMGIKLDLVCVNPKK